MNYTRLVFSIFALSTLIAWQTASCQTVVQNPTANQSITQPSGTTFSVDGVGGLTWPSLFRIAPESGNMVFRDMTQTDAWFFIPQNLGSGSGQITFFGNFSNGGSLIPLSFGKGSIGTSNNAWGLVVAINGSFAGLSKGLGNFKIDHPLDPLNKFLQHSFVESPDMKNVYDGLVILDNHGEAWITLPNWFQALNSDYRYLLTAVGRSNPNLYVKDEISSNKFRIAGGKPGSKVSWQVTGIRQDALANANRIQVEVDKPLDQRGKLYYPPELYKTKSIKSEEAVASSSPNATTAGTDKENESPQAGHR